MSRALLSALLLLSWTAAASATTPLRVLRQFDFEERARGNAEDVPMDWVKVEGAGFPHYANATLATDQAVSGRYAFRFDLNGGSVAYRYPAGKIIVHTHAHYAVAVMARTEGLVNARARLTAYCADARGEPIRSTVTRSEPLRDTPDGWTPLQIELTAPDGSASLVLELALLQAPMWQRPIGNASLSEQDITGHAWFDDVSVRQVPQVRLACETPGHVFRQSDPIALTVRLNDRLTDDLVGRLVVVDAEGRRVFQRTGPFDLTPAGDMDRGTRVVLPDLPAGWYRAELGFESDGTGVGSSAVDFVRLADDGVASLPDARFGVVATHLPFAAWDALPDVLPVLGVSRVKLSVWNDAGDAETAPGLDFDRLLDRLAARQIRTTGCFTGVPPKVAAGVGGADLRDLARATPEAWQPQLALFAARYAGHVDRWQVGCDEQAAQFVTDDELRQAYARVLRPMTDLFDPPDLAMPWPAWFDVQPTTPANVALSVPTDVLPEQLPAYVDDLRHNGRPNAALSLQALDADRYGRVAMLRDLAQRIGYALSSSATRIDLPLPYRDDGQPQEAVLPERTLLSNLGNATFRGHLPLDADTDALLFDRDGEGVVLMWTTSPQAKPRTVAMTLGAEPRTMDLYGNTSPVLRPKSADGTTDVVVGPVPSLLVGIDGRLARLRTGFSWDDPLVESSFKPHVRRLRFTNPYETPITGRLRLSGPAGWSFTPQQPEFSLAPGATYDAAVTVEFPYHSVAGLKPVVCDVQLDGDHAARLKVPVGLKLGLGDIGLTTTAFRDGDAVVVQQMVTNYSGRPLDYTAYASYPGAARQERLLTAIPPGTTVIKRYRFPNAAPGQKAHSGLQETEGTRVLNDEVAVP